MAFKSPLFSSYKGHPSVLKQPTPAFALNQQMKLASHQPPVYKPPPRSGGGRSTFNSYTPDQSQFLQAYKKIPGMSMVDAAWFATRGDPRFADMFAPRPGLDPTVLAQLHPQHANFYPGYSAPIPQRATTPRPTRRPPPRSAGKPRRSVSPAVAKRAAEIAGLRKQITTLQGRLAPYEADAPMTSARRRAVMNRRRGVNKHIRRKAGRIRALNAR